MIDFRPCGYPLGTYFKCYTADGRYFGELIEDYDEAVWGLLLHEPETGSVFLGPPEIKMIVNKLRDLNRDA